MYVLCTGARDWDDIATVRRALETLPPESHLVEGGAKGADALCALVARELGFTVHEVRADWNRYGRAAGPLRNRKMLDEFPLIDIVFAFHRDLTQSRGTKDMVRQAGQRGIPVKIFTGGE